MKRKRPDCWRLRGQDSLPNTNKHLPLGAEDQKADGGGETLGRSTSRDVRALKAQETSNQ